MTKVTAHLTEARSVQEYIDETPRWPDGTGVRAAPMTPMQWRIWLLASAGKFFEGLVVFVTGVALPLMVFEFGLGAMEKGAVGAATLLGILFGATLLGGLSDRFGRKRLFIVEMALFAAGLLLLVVSPNLTVALVALLGMGLALGCDYPTAHLIISESIPTAARGRLVLGAFAFQALGALVGTAVGYLILYQNPDIGAWRWMYATAVIPAILVTVARFFIPDSGHWLVSRGRIEDARRAILNLLRREPPYPTEVRLAPPPAGSDPQGATGSLRHFTALFSRKHRRATILSSVPWFLQDLGTYGIGIFTPTILASIIGADTGDGARLADIVHNDLMATKGAAFIDALLIVGIVCAVFLADRVGRMRLQILGFVGCAAGLLLATLSLQAGEGARMVFLYSGFMLFNFMTNVGPNAMTYLVAGEVFPTAIRGMGAGFAASFAKIGAVMTAFFFPVLLKDIGIQWLLYGLVGCSLLGAAVTWRFRIETAGISLEDV